MYQGMFSLFFAIPYILLVSSNLSITAHAYGISTVITLFTNILCLQNSIRERNLDKLDTFENITSHNYTDVCDYIDIEDCKDISVDTNDLCVIKLNIRGLVNKQLELYRLLRSITQLACIDIVILVETWVTKESEARISIPGYTYYGSIHPNKKGGGVGFLIHNDISYTQHPDLCLTTNVAESCFLELRGQQKNIIVGSIYRPPNTCIKEFNSWFGEQISKVSKESRKEIILGLDHNLDFLKHHVHHRRQDFLELIMDSGLIPAITRPTRITPNSATLIDNIFLSINLTARKRTGIIVFDLSDHMPYITIVRDCKIRKDQIAQVLKHKLTE